MVGSYWNSWKSILGIMLYDRYGQTRHTRQSDFLKSVGIDRFVNPVKVYAVVVSFDFYIFLKKNIRNMKLKIGMAKELEEVQLCTYRFEVYRPFLPVVSYIEGGFNG